VHYGGSVVVFCYTIFLRLCPGREVKYCNEHVHLSVHSHISNHMSHKIFYMCYIGHGLVFLWWQCNLRVYNVSPVISHGQSCGSAACPLDSTKSLTVSTFFFSAGAAQSAAAWSPVNCACVPQLFQQLINITLCPAFLRKFVCKLLCCVSLQMQTFYPNLVLVTEYYIDCWQIPQWSQCCDEFPMPQTGRKSK